MLFQKLIQSTLSKFSADFQVEPTFGGSSSLSANDNASPALSVIRLTQLSKVIHIALGVRGSHIYEFQSVVWIIACMTWSITNVEI